MKSIGFPPGSNNFRLLVVAILVAAFWVFFLDYTDSISIETEKASIQQTKNIINSSLAIVFATYAVRGELGRLNELNGGNPFEHLAEFNLLPGNYQGKIKGKNLENIDPGWYYDEVSMEVIYKPYFDEQVFYFSQILDYRDINESGRYEPEIDVYQALNFR